MLYRIGHSRRSDGSRIPDWENFTSPWWITDSTFLEIAGRSEDAGTEIGLLVRMKLALTPDFGCCDTLFRVQLKNTLRAWNGRGFPVFENGTPEERERDNLPMAWHGGYEIAQNFVPGLRDFANNRPTQCALDSLNPLPPLPLTSYARVRDGGHAFIPFPWPVP
ncbi:hypothetical protein EOD42_12470 [Rhodovarius crocodyli]|uniref:Uncharacterized protein n=1 Tax=Rhodovarius crocodyli TaxID=1979269 RepID=A0A437MEA1_9PROT|nr:hypothetical protein [Rhodovarius crocodyli]RVT95942.1 hypothetical protein EOD42_12470 [Rhodovarius crocodyli]